MEYGTPVFLYRTFLKNLAHLRIDSTRFYRVYCENKDLLSL